MASIRLLERPKESLRRKRFLVKWSKPIRFGERHKLSILNIAQILSVLNDNLFKFTAIFFLLDLKGQASTGDIVSWIGVMFVLPFLLFSSTCGVISDRFSKSRVIIFSKGLEVVLMALSIIVFQLKLDMLVYPMMFLICLQSTILSPAKYAIIPELFKREKFSKVSGAITSSSYVSMVMGSFLASFLAQITNRNFPWVIAICLLFAVVGFVASMMLPYTRPMGSKKKLGGFFIKQVVDTMKLAKKVPNLTVCIYGNAFFLFFGAFLQLNIIPFAIEALGLTDVQGGYIFVMAALGIAIGSFLSGKIIAGREVELGLAPVAGVFMIITMMLFPIVATSLRSAMIICSILGFFAGLFQVPLDTFIQSYSDEKNRGQVIAASNFLSFVGVLIAPLCIYLLSSVFHLRSTYSFVLMAFVDLFIALALFKSVAPSTFRFISERFIQPFYEIHFLNSVLNFREELAICCRKMSWPKIFLILGESSKFHLFIVKAKKGFFDPLIGFIGNIDYIYYGRGECIKQTVIIQKKLEELPPKVHPFFVFYSEAAYTHFQTSIYRETLLNQDYSFQEVTIRHRSHFRPSFPRVYKRSQLTYQFINLD
ncbi:MAG: Lysophospholipid transporter LplT [Chlamydiia bacterium]|nr:Lysophospholipid transporter LplT [Chlamydiia bacterium]